MKLAKALQILESDRRPTILLGLTHFLVAAAHGLFDIAATALLIGRLGPDVLPQVYLGSAVFLIVMGVVVIPVVDRLDRVRLFQVSLSLFAVVLLFQGPLAERAPDLVYRALYIACYVMKSLLFLQFWLLAGDLLDLRQAKRLFPVLLGFSLVGGLFASVIASVLPNWTSTSSLLAGSGALLLIALVPVGILGRGGRVHRRRVRPGAPVLSVVWMRFRSDLRMAWSTSLLRSLSLCLLLLALLAQVLDYLLGEAAHFALTGDVRSLTTFYAVLNGAVIGTGAVVQFLIANRLISAMGVTRAQLLAPLTFILAFMVSGAVFLASGETTNAFAFFVTIVAARALQKALRISLVRSSTDLIYNAIPAERRGPAKALKETMIEPLGVLLGGAFLMAGTVLPTALLLAASLLLSMLFLGAAATLKEHYLESLVSVLKEKSRFRYAFPSVIMRRSRLNPDADPSVSGIRRALSNDEASIRLLAVEVASGLREPEAANLLVDRYRKEPNEEVRARMLSALGKMIHQPEGAAEGDALSEMDPMVRASALEALAQSGIFRAERTASERRSRDLLPGGERGESEAEAEAEAEGAGSIAERRRAFLELARTGEDRAFERLVHYLEEGSGATRHLAARALESCGERAVDVLTLALWSSDVEGRRYVIRALDRIGTKSARQALLPVLALEAEEAYYELVRVDALGSLGTTQPIELLRDSLRQRVDRARRNAVQVLRAVFLGEPGMRLILSNLNHPDRFVRSSAIEALEVRVDPGVLGGILPLFEHENPRAIAEHGGAYFEMPDRAPLDVLVELTRHRGAWIRACAVFALGEVGGRDVVARLEELVNDDDELTRLNAVEALGRLGDRTVLGVLERLRTRSTDRLGGYAERAIQAIGARTSTV